MLKGFEWASVREVAYDRLEGSRRSIQGHEKEIAVRASVIAALERSTRSMITTASTRVRCARHPDPLRHGDFDVSVALEHPEADKTCKILVPVKSRETEGGGHAHIFTRDINSAIDASKQGTSNYVVAFIIAQSWAQREQEHVAAICDLAIIIPTNPNNFGSVPANEQAELDEFIRKVLTGEITPKRWEEIRGLLDTE